MPDPIAVDPTTGKLLDELLHHPEVEQVTIAKGAPVLVGVKKYGGAMRWTSGEGGSLFAALMAIRQRITAPPPAPEIEP